MAVFSIVAAPSASRIILKGSDTMVILAQRWAEEFMKKTPSVSIQVTGGGSGTGFAALINGTTDLCNASRPIKASETEKIRKKFNRDPVEIKTAVDGIAVYVNETNPVKELTLAQLKAIFTGTLTNWKDVGGADAKIIMYGRDNSSGTYEFFREHVLQGSDYAAAVQGMPGTAALVQAVAADKMGIGYGGTAYGKGIRFVMVKKDDTTAGVTPTTEAIKNGTYPISRFLYFYMTRKPAGDIRKFIDWVLSPEGQKIVESVGYFPL
jgi:phosphate transport system substrate-binding protein